MSIQSQRRPLLSKDEEAADDERTATAKRGELEAASLEVDQTLIRWSLSLSIRERLRAATQTARMLGRFRRVPTSQAG